MLRSVTIADKGKALARVLLRQRQRHSHNHSSGSSNHDYYRRNAAPIAISVAATLTAAYAVAEPSIRQGTEKQQQLVAAAAALDQKAPSRQEIVASSAAAAPSWNIARPSLSSSSWHNTSVTNCDMGMLSSPFASVMTRQQTMAYIDQTAKPTNALHERYQIANGNDALLGVGNFGAVQQAMDRTTRQPVAIKRLPKASTSHVAIQRELQALLAIQQAGGHPNLTALREYFQDDSEQDAAYYLVMELVPGGELFDALCTHGALTEADAARFTRQLASALQFLHALGLVHADVKPENCILSEPNARTASVKMVDFGCCTPVANGANETNKETAAVAGSPSRQWFGSREKKANHQPENDNADNNTEHMDDMLGYLD